MNRYAVDRVGPDATPAATWWPCLARFLQLEPTHAS